MPSGSHLDFVSILSLSGNDRGKENRRPLNQSSTAFNILAFSFPNVSIAILIERLLDPNVPRRIVMYIMVWMQVLFAFVAVVLYFAQCSPVQHLWDSGRVPGTCWDPNVFFNYYYFFSAYTALVDLILAVVPITAFWQLQMKQSTRMGLCLMMALTLLSAVVTVAKTCYIPLLARKDLLYDVIPLVQWGLVEQNVVIMAACVPTLRPFFSAFGGTLRSGASASDPKGAPSYGSTVRSPDRFSSTAQVRLESSQSEVELNDVEAVKSAACDADAKRQELHSSAGSSGDDAGTLNGCNITRTVQVNVDVRDRKGPAESKVKAYW